MADLYPILDILLIISEKKLGQKKKWAQVPIPPGSSKTVGFWKGVGELQMEGGWWWSALVGRRVRLCGVEVGMFLRARGVIEMKVMGVGGVEGRVTGMG